jgi:hypothetical protein
LFATLLLFYYQHDDRASRQFGKLTVLSIVFVVVVVDDDLARGIVHLARSFTWREIW